MKGFENYSFNWVNDDDEGTDERTGRKPKKAPIKAAKEESERLSLTHLRGRKKDKEKVKDTSNEEPERVHEAFFFKGSGAIAKPEAKTWLKNS